MENLCGRTPLRRTGVKQDACEPKRNCIEPHRIDLLVLVSEAVRTFGGIKYDNKPKIKNTFLEMYLQKCGQAEVYNDASNNVLEISEESSGDEEATLLPPPTPPHYPSHNILPSIPTQTLKKRARTF